MRLVELLLDNKAEVNAQGEAYGNITAGSFSQRPQAGG
jgi:hypothetical protein